MKPPLVPTTTLDSIGERIRKDAEIYENKLTPEERAEVDAFNQATMSMTMIEIMKYTDKTQADGHHPFYKYREKYKDDLTATPK